MGDEGPADMASPPAAKRLKRVAEVVLVLSAMAEMRGGKDPTPVEKAMAAEARESLTGLCQGFKPKDLFPKEAIPAMVEELGLRKDTAMGFRPLRVPISDRILLTKRKLEGPKEVPMNQYYPSQQVPVAFGASQISVPGGGQHHMQTVSSSVQTRRSHMNEKLAGITVSTPPPAIPRSEPPHLRPNGMAHLAQTRAPKTANLQFHPDKKEKTVDHTSLRSAAAPHTIRPAQNNEVKPPTVQPGPANFLIGLPAPQGITFVPAQSIYSSHADISKKVQQIIQAKRDSTHPSWTPPSSDYMNKPLLCQACNAVVSDVDSLLICDQCERGTHLRCLESNGKKVEVPKAEWHCQRCLAASHGKTLPPKYGKVTRTLGTVKAVTAVRKENPQLKDDQKKTIPNGVVTNLPNTAAGVNSGNLINVQIVSNNLKDRTVAPPSVIGVKTETGTGGKTEAVTGSKTKAVTGDKTEAVTGDKTKPVTGDRTEAVTGDRTEAVTGDRTEAVTGDRTEFVTGDRTESVNGDRTESVTGDRTESVTGDKTESVTGDKTESVTDDKTESGTGDKTETSTVVKTEAGMTVKTENQKSQNDQSTNLITSAPKEPVGEKGNASPDQQQVDKDSNQENGVAASEKSVFPEVCWVGDAGEVIDGKSYYSSCCINKTTYKLQDHVLISSDGGRFIPSKIKSLWESKEPGSKLAVVNPYYLPSDLPESVSCSSGGVEDNEVYASDNKETICISLISGPCEVLRSDRFEEENEKRNMLADSNNNFPPIFLCRWKYDDTNGILRPLTN